MTGRPESGAGSATARPRATYLGVPVEFHRALASTNDEALRRATDGAPEGLVVVADEQSAGRGRLGRSWWGAPGESLLFSLLLRPQIEVSGFPLLGIAMAAAVAEAGGAATGAALAVKWPNDVLHGERKLCGVLAESRSGGSGTPALVIGAGINVGQRADAFPAEIRDRATSLRVAAVGRNVDREALLAAILSRFERYRRIARDEGAGALRAALDDRLPARGTFARVAMGDRVVAGTIEEVTETGALRIRDSEGGTATVAAGELT